MPVSSGPVVVIQVLQERFDTGPEQVRSADLAQPGRDLPVIQAGIVTALAADDLERAGAGVAAWVAGAETGGLAPERDGPVQLALVVSHWHGVSFGLLASGAVPAGVRAWIVN